MARDWAILADLDGTLIDSKASVEAAWGWWAELRGLDRASVVARLPHGEPSEAAVALLAPHLDPDAESPLLHERQAGDTDGVVALPGARELLEAHERLAIVTSCTLLLARARLLAAGLPEPPVLVTPEQVTRGKPDPEPYLLGAERLGAAPEDCLVLEDAPAGVRAGVAAGMTVIALLTTHGRTALPGASAYIAGLPDLPAALAAL